MLDLAILMRGMDMVITFLVFETRTTLPYISGINITRFIIEFRRIMLHVMRPLHMVFQKLVHDQPQRVPQRSSVLNICFLGDFKLTNRRLKVCIGSVLQSESVMRRDCLRFLNSHVPVPKVLKILRLNLIFAVYSARCFSSFILIRISLLQ